MAFIIILSNEKLSVKRMVSTRGIKYKFAVNERVLCYEPGKVLSLLKRTTVLMSSTSDAFSLREILLLFLINR